MTRVLANVLDAAGPSVPALRLAGAAAALQVRADLLRLRGRGAARAWRRCAGCVLAGWRLLRCNPFSHGGYDPVEAQRLFSDAGLRRTSSNR